MDTTANPSPARLRSMPSWVINQTAIAANRLTDRALADTGSRRYHFAMLAALDEFGPSSQAELGRCTGIDRSDVVAAVNAMVEQGHLERTPDPADARRNIVTLSPAGKHHLEHLADLLTAAQTALLQPLTADESTVLLTLLTRIIDQR